MIEKYLANHYEWPPCWQLVADVYVNELGLCVDDYTPKTDSMRDVANAFRLALHDNKHGFTQQQDPNNYDVVLLGKNKKVTHCGLYYNSGVLHSLKNMVIWQPMAQITDTYGLIEYYRHDRND
ncbi:MAG: C40 family peptidase [Chitinophagaceae bacterium]|nr:C40 family peptidase [Chitinophagaceae bacterium]